jgi:hypothetical protein
MKRLLFKHRWIIIFFMASVGFGALGLLKHSWVLFVIAIFLVLLLIREMSLGKR